MAQRNTPTGVGKTRTLFWKIDGYWKHPHGRGEDHIDVSALALVPETPPRAWGRPPVGEPGTLARSETPPRAWGRHRNEVPELRLLGNTPTGVGKTRRADGLAPTPWKHPHGRGEDANMTLPTQTPQETPPRAWGRRNPLEKITLHTRNTPTGVGKTQGRAACRVAKEKHPHGRGEDLPPKWRRVSGPETPPRAWGRHSDYDGQLIGIRNTPTGVGKTAAG